jgi:nitrate reductase NapE component
MAEKMEDTWVETVPTTLQDVKPTKSKREKRLLLKMDLSIIPLLALSFLIAYMVCIHDMLREE